VLQQLCSPDLVDYEGYLCIGSSNGQSRNLWYSAGVFVVVSIVASVVVVVIVVV
jgi:hypothetical protein